MDFGEAVSQIIDFTGTTPEIARQAASAYPNDLQRAINAVVDDEFTNRSVTLNAPKPSPDLQAVNGGWVTPPPQHSPEHVSAWLKEANVTTDVNSRPRRARKSSTNNRKGGSESPTPANNTAEIIDLTGDAEGEDDDMRRAVEASLMDHQPSASEQRFVGPLNINSGGNNSMEEDSELTQALALSMHEASSLPFGDDAGADALNMQPITAKSKRDSGVPVAITMPWKQGGSRAGTDLKFLSLILRAYYAATPIRLAMLNFKMPDTRVGGHPDDLRDYHRGKSPQNQVLTSSKRFPEFTKLHEQSALDLIQRIQLLFTFMAYSMRSQVCSTDLSYVIPPQTLRRHSENVGLGDITETFCQDLNNAWLTATKIEASAAVDRSTRSGTQQHAQQQTRKFVSSVMSALAVPESADPPVYNPFASAPSVTLTPTLFSSSITSSLRDVLRKEKILINEPAHALCMHIKHGWNDPTDNAPPAAAGALPNGTSAPRRPLFRHFKLEPRIYLDGFMWQRRDGVGFASDGDTVQRNTLEQRRDRLQTRLRKISKHNGQDSISLLQDALAHFERRSEAPSTDAVRAEQEAEAAPRLREIIKGLTKQMEKLKAEIAATDSELQLLAKQEEEAAMKAIEGEEWKTMPYDLCAVLMQDGSAAWGYFKDDEGKWWREEEIDGEAHHLEVSEEVALNDTTGQDHGAGVYWLVYTRYYSSLLPVPWCPQGLQDAIEADNEELERQLELLDENGQFVEAAAQPYYMDTREELAGQWDVAQQSGPLPSDSSGVTLYDAPVRGADVKDPPLTSPLPLDEGDLLAPKQASPTLHRPEPIRPANVDVGGEEALTVHETPGR